MEFSQTSCLAWPILNPNQHIKGNLLSHQPNPELSNQALDYPFGKRWSPEPGKPFEVADGVYWLRMPLPIALDHINLWLLKDDDGMWTIVDTGYDDQSCKDVWEEVFASFCSPENIKQIIITHFHPDHIGLAAWLANRCNVPILISKGEFDHYTEIVNRDADAFAKTVLTFAGDIGFNEQVAHVYASFFGQSKKSPDARVQKEQCIFIKEGDGIKIADRLWCAVAGNGHSPEHICLFNEDLNTLISGDQAIARISSNVSVYPSDPTANPLKDWLESCVKLRDQITADALILASHQEPFKGIKARMQKMIDDHHADLELLRQALVHEMSAVQARKILFNRELDPIQTVLATGETLSHLNYLIDRGYITSNRLNGVTKYKLV